MPKATESFSCCWRIMIDSCGERDNETDLSLVLPRKVVRTGSADLWSQSVRHSHALGFELGES